MTDDRFSLLSDANFVNWFGASKMVDRQTGAPLIFFHKSRSKEKFNEFKHIGVEKNPYNKDYGFYFVEPMDKRYIQHLGHWDIYCYLRMKRPFYIHDNGSGFIYDETGVRHNPLYIDMDLCNKIKNATYDGIVISQPKYFNTYIVFDPNSIKSIENAGTFSLTSNNIFE
jgi:hypothetical protein